MNARSREEIRDIILNDFMVIHNRREEMSKRLAETLEDNLSYVRELAAQLSQPSSGPLVPKTPKMLRKRAVQRIETIPENDVFQQANLSPTSSVQSVNEDERKESEVTGHSRAKRGASKRAADNIKKQSLILNDSAKKVKRDSQIKRKKSAASSSDEDNNERTSKYSKVEENQTEAKGSTRRVTRKQSKQIAQPMETVNEANNKKIKEENFESPVLRRSSRGSSNTASSKSFQNREVNKVDDPIVAPNSDDVEEPSMYEDAIGKPIPIMNSTLKHSLMPLNATVVLERLPQQPKLNETVVIQREASVRNNRSKEKESSKKTSQDSTQQYKAPAQYNDCNGLITDDESSPELKKPKKQLNRKQINKKQTKPVLSTSSEDEIPNTPVKNTRLRDVQVASKVAQESKTMYKSNALFSPYAKESVKKRVEAFEQAVMYSPKPKADADPPVRITRTKTRAMAATAEMETETKNTEKSVAQILARKSLVKAKKISLAKQKKIDEFKEVKESVNKEQLPERINKLLHTQTDKTNVKQIQQLKTTPLSKLKLMQPILSVNRLHTPSNTQNLSNYSKTLTASRTNIVTNVESWIQPPKSMTKTNSAETLDEKKRPEEDARKKKEEALRLQTEEKRRKRQEKELKNRLAREAKERQELEKRQRDEREKEEKAKLHLEVQERQRAEIERKRQAQIQRAQEKEERRKLEEEQRLLELQKKEAMEQRLDEQRRWEQEEHKRREAERARQAAAEALKQKSQLLAAQAKHKLQANNNKQGAVNYVLDSEPDDDESDDESRPKHEIPYWAQPHVRKAQLAMQLQIPDDVVYKFFGKRQCTPDLTELFHGIDRNRLKRTSSAIWKTPPRISMMETEFVVPKLS